MNPRYLQSVAFLIAISAALAGVRSRTIATEPARDARRTNASERNDGSETARSSVAHFSEDQAIERAATRLGLMSFPKQAASARLVKLARGSVPSLDEQLAGRTVWQVEFSKLDLERDAGKRDLRNPHLTRFRVILTPETHEILTVQSIWPEDTAAAEPKSPYASEERQLKATSTAYSGLPGRAPGIACLDALTMSDFWDANVTQVHACYVIESSPADEARAVWVVFLWDKASSFPISLYPGVSEDRLRAAQGWCRTVVDGQTGKGLSSEPVFSTRQPARK